MSEEVAPDGMSENVIDAWAEEPPYEYKGIETPEISQLEFNLCKIQVEEYSDVEETAMDYYSQCGYSVYNLKQRHQDKLSKIFPFFKGKSIFEPGCPDLFAFRVFQELNFQEYGHNVESRTVMSNYRFVEVKSENDGLRPSQLEWISKHNHLPIDVMVVEEPQE